MEWVEAQLDDETARHATRSPLPRPRRLDTDAHGAQIFPQRPEQPFPATFMDTVRTIFKRLFRVYAHIYHSHWDVMVSLSAEAHLNTCFKHFMYFTHAFALIDKKELAPLAGAPPQGTRVSLLPQLTACLRPEMIDKLLLSAR
jgi:hypothetical protein